jgi:hypothetical protein
LDDKAALLLRSKGGYQTNSHQSQLAAETMNLSGTKLKPLGKSGGAYQFEGVSTGDRSFLIEMVVGIGLEGGEFLHTSHAPETLHDPFYSSKREAQILRPIIKPLACTFL